MAELAAGNILAQPLAEMLRSITIICALACALTIACAPAVRRSGGLSSAAQLDEFWIDPGPTPRRLFAGPPANGSVRPATDARFTVVKRDTGGFSIAYRVRDERGREWSVSTNLKKDDNTVYDVLGRLRERATRWYVNKDIGASLGETGRMDPRRGDIDGLEREPFITGVENGSAAGCSS
jgi:hypothetical protein